ncbi:hypothetical protein ACES2L_11600 [Bdellovibrio bacteriovorus]
MRIYHIVTVLVLLSSRAFAKSESNTLAVGQGIAAPAVTSPINYSNGFTHENPAVAATLSGGQLSLEYDTGKDNDENNQSGLGVELGYGNGNAGAMAGYYKRDCEGCEGRAGGILGVGTSSFAFGIGYREENSYSAGLLFNQSGSHRFGITADFEDVEAEGQDLRTMGVGYAYQGNSFTFVVDASKRDDEAGGTNNDVVLVTPGLLVDVDKIAVSISYDMYLNDESEVYEDDVWFGVAIKGSLGQLIIYHDYVNNWALVGALSF